jgi:transcriptional regulator with XRE-family HTH domain
MDQEKPLPFGPYLKSLRRQRHLTQTALSRRAGIAQSYLSALERGVVVNPSREIIRRLAEALSIRAEELACTNELTGLDLVPKSDQDLADVLRCWLEMTPAQRTLLRWIFRTVANHPPANHRPPSIPCLGEADATPWTHSITAHDSGSPDRI